MIISISKYESMAILLCHGNQSSYPIRTKQQQQQQEQLFVAQPIDATVYMTFGKNRLKGFRGGVV